MTKVKALQAATSEYAEKLKAIFGEVVKVEIDLEGVKLTDIAEIALEVKCDDGGKLEIVSNNTVEGLFHHVNAQINGNNYSINYITE
jgi:hypothetical protein